MYSGGEGEEVEEEEEVGSTAVRCQGPAGLDRSCAVLCCAAGLQLTGPEVGVGAHHAHDQ